MLTTKNLATIDVTALADVHGGKKAKEDAGQAAAPPKGLTQFGFNDVKQGFSISLTRS